MNREPEEEFRDLIGELRRTAPEPPPVHWGAYRAELREKLERRRARPRGFGEWSWKSRPLQVAVAAGFVAVLAWVGMPAQRQSDPALIENAILASRLDVIAELDVVQKLDLLEDFEVIHHLDALSPTSEG